MESFYPFLTLQITHFGCAQTVTTRRAAFDGMLRKRWTYDGIGNGAIGADFRAELSETLEHSGFRKDAS